MAAPTPPLNRQAVELAGTRRPGQTGIFRRVGYETKLVTSPINAPEIRTMHDVFLRGYNLSPHGQYIGTRPFNSQTKTYGPYEWQTYTQVLSQFQRFGSGLVYIHSKKFGLDPKTNLPFRQWPLGIWASTRPEWSMAALACNGFDIISVGLYDTLGPEAVTFGLNHSECLICLTSIDHVKGLLEGSNKTPFLKVVISMESLEGDDEQGLKLLAEKNGIELLDWKTVSELGEQFPRDFTPATPESVYTHCYTSGTTGNPKAAILKHHNICATLGNTTTFAASLTTTDTGLSFLPLAHLFGRMTESILTLNGARYGYSTGNPLTLLQDIQALQPTYMPSVPRVLNRIYAQLNHQLFSTGSEQDIEFAKKALTTKLDNLENGLGNKHPDYDALLFSKLHNIIGGKVKLIMVGSAPIPAKVLAFLRVVLCLDIIEGYGQTESGGSISGTILGENTAGHVGPPAPANEIKFVDVPELNYFTTDQPFPRGEICVRGANIFSGYLKDEKKTKEAIDEEGWLHTGDVGLIEPTGRITIIDRIKNVFKLSQGEYVAIERIENVLNPRVPILQQMMVYGERTESFLLAVVVPDPVTFVPFAKRILIGELGTRGVGKLGETLEEEMKVLEKYFNRPKLMKAVVKEIQKGGVEGGLKGYEIPKAVVVSMEPFTIENDLLTPTSKIKRQSVVQLFKKQLTQLYKKTNAAQAKL